MHIEQNIICKSNKLPIRERINKPNESTNKLPFIKFKFKCKYILLATLLERKKYNILVSYFFIKYAKVGSVKKLGPDQAHGYRANHLGEGLDKGLREKSPGQAPANF